MSVFQDVLVFLRIGHPDKIRETPGLPTAEHAALAQELVREEYEDELKPALESGDLVQIADAVADCIWVLIALAHFYGLPIEEIWAEVRRANMDKFPGGLVMRRPDQKIIKPFGWTPPDIKTIFERSRPCAHCGEKLAADTHRLPILGGTCVFRATAP